MLRAAVQGAAAGALSSGCAEGHRGGPVASMPHSPAPDTRTPLSQPPLPASLPPQITNGPRDRALVALTFHGQGDPKLATALLSEAERAGAQLTVLAVGSWLDAYPEMAHRVLDGGHELGNHTQNHLAICDMSADEASAEITGCAQRLQKLTGSISRWFRPSQAQYATPLVEQLARTAGYPHVLSYDVDSLDYTDPGADAVRNNVLRAVGRGSVVSLHFGHTGTVEALPAVLDGLSHRGLRAVTTSELLK
ncbi:MAG: polysaccharide deacetylase family protein [Streptomycetaceae bacterium]|nr:polysaccharide deacetylase family protein [Streptomycetaceae bacterium]